MKPLSVYEIQTIKLLADNGMSITRTAEKSFCARKSIYRRLHSIKRKTGHDPLDFWGLMSLVEIIEYERRPDVERGRSNQQASP